MEKRDAGILDFYEQFIIKLERPGVLLGTTDNQGRANVMTIGWCTIGRIWGKSICTVMVRPSRHSYTCLEDVQQFTISAGGVDDDVVQVCGKICGRDEDKFALTKITAEPAKKVKPPIVKECTLHYECNVVNYCDVNKMNLRQNINSTFYPSDDYHRVYFGEIAACYGVL